MYKTVVGIDGMVCSMCEAHINDAVRRAFSVKKVSSSHKKKQAEIISKEKPDEEALRKAINETGYNVLSIKTEPYEKKGFNFFKKISRKIY
ncbi:MAG TPA: cation transporter [Mobilitalea sp.]|nr:cation transporter [Mobilitalea sp.]